MFGDWCPGEYRSLVVGSYPKYPWDTAAAEIFCLVLSPPQDLCQTLYSMVSPVASQPFPFGSVDVHWCPDLFVSPLCLMKVCQTDMWTKSNHRGAWRDQQTWTDGPRPIDRLERDMESLQRKKWEKEVKLKLTFIFIHCIPLEAYQCLPGDSAFEDSCSKLVQWWWHIWRILKTTGQPTVDIWTPALLVAGALIAAGQTGVGFADRSRGRLGWGLAAETEVEAEASLQVLAVAMVGLITEAKRENVKR